MGHVRYYSAHKITNMKIIMLRKIPYVVCEIINLKFYFTFSEVDL